MLRWSVSRRRGVPLTRLFAGHTGAVLAGSGGAIGVFTIFYLATSYALAQGAGPLGYTREAFPGGPAWGDLRSAGQPGAGGGAQRPALAASGC